MDTNVLPLNLPEPIIPATLPASAPVIAYESEFVTVYHGRAEHLLPSMRTESVDLVVTDPPYGKEWESKRRKESFGQLVGDGADDASRALHRANLAQCVRVVGQHRHLYCFGPDLLTGHKVSDVVELIWDKGSMGSGDVTAPWGPQHEPINFTVSKHRHAGKAGQGTIPTRLRKGSVLSFQKPTGKAVRHPDEKPVPLLAELIESSSKRGETVLDVYAGVLSTAVAAILTGRRAIVCEADWKWIEVGLPRIHAAEKIAAAMNGI